MKAFLTSNPDRTFSIQVGYHPDIVAFFKTIEGKRYDAESQSFTIDAAHKNKVIEFLVGISVTIDEVHKIPTAKPFAKTAKWKRTGEELEIYLQFNSQIAAIMRSHAAMFKRATCRWHVPANSQTDLLNEIEAHGFVCKEVASFTNDKQLPIQVIFFTLLSTSRYLN